MFITHHENLGSTPARVNRFTGEIQLNDAYWLNMPEELKPFIVEHEKGHFLTQTRNEFLADAYAFSHVVGKQPKSLKNAVYSLSKVLTFKNPQHLERVIEVVRLAFQYDYQVNGNTEALQGLQKLNILTNNKNKIPMKLNIATAERPSYNNARFGYDNFEDDYDNGAGKERRQAKRAAKTEQKQKKAELKNDRLAAKNEIKLARADAKRTKADAKKSLADQGKSGTDWIKDAAGAIGGIFGSKSQDSAASVTTTATGIEEPKKLFGMPQKTAYAVIALVVIVIGVSAYLFLKKKA